MQKVNINDLPEQAWASPKGKYACSFKLVSEALGRDVSSLDLAKRHPFDVEICRVPSGKMLCPYHSHSAQWEFYIVLSGAGQVRHEGGLAEVVAGDAFVFKPTEAHTLSNAGPEDLVYYVIADNPVGDCCHYPDSSKISYRQLTARACSTKARKRITTTARNNPPATKAAAARTRAAPRPPRPRW